MSSQVMEVQIKKAPKFVLYKGKASKPATIARAIRSLCMVLEVGESESRALEIAGQQFHKYEIGRAFEHAAEVMRNEGATFKQALLAEEVIPRVARQLIEAAPTSQALYRNLKQAAILVTESTSVKKKLVLALIQPGFMFALATGLLFFAVAFIIPGFVDMFAQLGTETPQMTIVLLEVANIAKWVVGGLIALILALVAFWFLYGRRSERVRIVVDKMLMRTPGIGTILQLAATSRLFQLLAANLSTGIQETESLKAAAQGCGNAALKAHCENHAERMMTEGVPLKGFADSRLLPVDGQKILGAAPSIQQEIGVMEELAPEYRNEANLQLETLTQTLEPMVNYLVYGLTGLLIVAIMLPMYAIYPALMDLG